MQPSRRQRDAACNKELAGAGELAGQLSNDPQCPCLAYDMRARLPPARLDWPTWPTSIATRTDAHVPSSAADSCMRMAQAATDCLRSLDYLDADATRGTVRSGTSLHHTVVNWSPHVASLLARWHCMCIASIFDRPPNRLRHAASWIRAVLRWT